MGQMNFAHGPCVEFAECVAFLAEIFFQSRLAGISIFVAKSNKIKYIKRRIESHIRLFHIHEVILFFLDISTGGRVCFSKSERFHSECLTGGVRVAALAELFLF